MLTRVDKEKQVIRLYIEGKTMREIAKEVHMSFGDIGVIIRKITGEDKAKEEIKLSKNTQALKLFYQGKRPIEVVIALDMEPKEVNRLYREYWELERKYALNNLYDDFKENIPSFIKLFNIMNRKNMGEEEILNVLRYVDELPTMNEYSMSLQADIRDLKRSR